MVKVNRSKKLISIKKELSEYLTNNPGSDIEFEGNIYYITNPWNDISLIITIPPKNRARLIEVLNNLILPPKFSAIYHVDNNTVEFIYTRLKQDDPILSRKFNFTLDNKSYNCKFGKSSERLTLIVECYARAKESRTDFRNLIYLEETEFEKEPTYTNTIPVSFYVEGFNKYNESDIEEVSKYINFYMQYFDRESAVILIHPLPELSDRFPALELIEGGFPNTISTRRKEPFLMDLILAACKVGNRLQFIYCYQLLEYAAFYYVDDEIKRELTHIISAPDIHSNPDKYVSRILDATSDIRQEVDPKIYKLIKSTCKPEIIFSEILQHKSYFSDKQEFDGGFILEPFISEDTSIDSFKPLWDQKIANTLKVIRNALVHGREKTFGKVINPTDKNDTLIKPWCCIIRRIAEQIVLFG